MKKLQGPPRERCSLKECICKPVYEVRLSLAVHGNHEPAITTPFAYLCEKHKNSLTFESLTPDSNWKMLCEGFASIGRSAPRKEFSKMLLLPISPDIKQN